ncbi:MAG TPA: Smr/MutS family protein [Rectinemataceae bacterium]
MNFGDILKDWEALRKSEQKAARMAEREKDAPKPGSSKKANAPEKPAAGQAGARGGARDGTAPALDASKTLERWLARNGVEDKDAGHVESEEEDRIRNAQRLRKLKPQAFLDLHGKTSQEAQILLSSFLASCQRQGLKKVLVIHGKGNHSPAEHVMTDLVRRSLEESEKAGAFGPADKEFGGRGATWVVLRSGTYFSR